MLEYLGGEGGEGYSFPTLNHPHPDELIECLSAGDPNGIVGIVVVRLVLEGDVVESRFGERHRLFPRSHLKVVHGCQEALFELAFGHDVVDNEGLQQLRLESAEKKYDAVLMKLSPAGPSLHLLYLERGIGSIFNFSIGVCFARCPKEHHQFGWKVDPRMKGARGTQPLDVMVQEASDHQELVRVVQGGVVESHTLTHTISEIIVVELIRELIQEVNSVGWNYNSLLKQFDKTSASSTTLFYLIAEDQGLMIWVYPGYELGQVLSQSTKHFVNLRMVVIFTNLLDSGLWILTFDVV